MDNLFTVARQVAALFVLMGFGALLRRTKLLGDAAVDGLVNMLILVVTPCVIVDVFQRPFDALALQSLGIAFLVAVLGHVVVIAVATALIRHRSDDTRRTLLLAAVFSNAGFMGLPLEQAVLGDVGVFYGAAYIIVFNLVIWSWGLRIMEGKVGGGRGSACRGEVWKMVFNPGTVGIMLGLPMFLLSVKLPSFLSVPLHHMANVNTPLAMIVILKLAE